MSVPFFHLFEQMPVLLITVGVLLLAIPTNDSDPFLFTDFVDDDSSFGE